MIKPLPGYVLIEPIDKEEVTSSGLMMPDKAKEKPAKGKVVAIGGDIPVTQARVMGQLAVDKDHGFLYEQSHVKVDEIVVFHRWSGQDVKDGQKEYKLVKFQDVLGVVE